MLLITTTTLFLGIYIPIASTIPTGVTPSSNLSALLVPRVGPGDNFCSPPWDWMRRVCVASVRLNSWRDVCRGDHQFYSSCPAGTVCQDVSNELDEAITCRPLQPQGSTSPREDKSDPQVGTSDKKSATNAIGTTQILHEVTIADNMKASVSAMVLDTSGSYAILTTNILTGTLRGTTTKVCEEDRKDDAKTRTCYPYGRFDLKKGDKIDFTFGLTSGQEVILTYVVWPST